MIKKKYVDKKIQNNDKLLLISIFILYNFYFVLELICILILRFNIRWEIRIWILICVFWKIIYILGILFFGYIIWFFNILILNNYYQEIYFEKNISFLNLI
jgi:hypothetical protein